MIIKNNYGLVNPEGNIIVTSGIRRIIPRDIDEQLEEDICTAFYLNSKIDSLYNNDYHLSMDQLMSRNVGFNCIDKKHEKLIEILKR